MANRIKVSDATDQTQALRARLNEVAGSRKQIKADEIKDDPVLFGLAKTVYTGCGAMDKVSVSQLRKALTAVGASIKAADANKDGEIGYQEARSLSPLAVRLLDQAAGDKVKTKKTKAKKTTPKKPSTAKPKKPTTTHTHTVSSGCGTGSTSHSSSNVSSGCGGGGGSSHVSSGC